MCWIDGQIDVGIVFVVVVVVVVGDVEGYRYDVVDVQYFNIGVFFDYFVSNFMVQYQIGFCCCVVMYYMLI